VRAAAAVLMGAGAPVRGAFGRPNFAPRLAILQPSLRDGTPVRFAYDVTWPRVTLVEPAQ
jgi:hypothetical protein